MLLLASRREIANRARYSTSGQAGSSVHPPSPLFSQVFILKAVKVLCFDTLLQVFILKGLTGAALLPSLELNPNNFDTETDTTRQRFGGVGLARGLRRTRWSVNFMSYDSSKWVCCQEKYILGELLVRTDWEVVEGARVTPCSVTSRRRTGIILDSRGGRGIRSHWKESPEIPVRSKNQGDGHDFRNAA